MGSVVDAYYYGWKVLCAVQPGRLEKQLVRLTVLGVGRHHSTEHDLASPLVDNVPVKHFIREVFCHETQLAEEEARVLNALQPLQSQNTTREPNLHHLLLSFDLLLCDLFT